MAHTTGQVPAGREPWAEDRTPADELLDLLRSGRPAWQRDGACLEHQEITWFPERGQDTAPAKAVCAGCLVRDECRAWSLAQVANLHGIWGELSQRERRDVRAGRPLTARAVRKPPSTRRTPAKTPKTTGGTVGRGCVDCGRPVAPVVWLTDRCSSCDWIRQSTGAA